MPTVLNGTPSARAAHHGRTLRRAFDWVHSARSSRFLTSAVCTTTTNAAPRNLDRLTLRQRSTIGNSSGASRSRLRIALFGCGANTGEARRPTPRYDDRQGVHLEYRPVECARLNFQ